MRSLRRKITWCAGLVLVAASLVACSANVTVGTESKLETTTTTAPSAAVRAVAAKYEALAGEMNTRMTPLQTAAGKLDPVHPDVATAKMLFAQQAAIVREFDTRLDTLTFPARLRPAVRALRDADEGVADGFDAMSAASCAETCSVYDTYAHFFKQRVQAINRLRADLGLPESGTLRP